MAKQSRMVARVWVGLLAVALVSAAASAVPVSDGSLFTDDFGTGDLSHMRMLRSRVNLEPREHARPELILRQHPFDRVLNNTSRVRCQHPAERDLFAVAGVLAMPDVDLLLGLVAGHPHRGGVGDNDKVARQQVGDVAGLVLAHQQPSHLRGQSAQYLT